MKSKIIYNPKSLEELTLIIPSHNRYYCLQKVLEFYQSYHLPLKIIILDSTTKEEPKAELLALLSNPSITHVRMEPEKVPVNKFRDGVKLVTTPYAFFCADDDFVSLYGALACLDFLKNNPDFVATQGITYHHHWDKTADGKEKKLHFVPSYPSQVSFDQSTSSERLLASFGNYRASTFYAVHRTPVLLRAFDKLVGMGTNEVPVTWGFSELVPHGITVIAGKCKYLEFFYASRSADEVSISLADGFTDLLNTRYNAARCEQAVHCLATEIEKFENIGYSKAKLISKQAVDCLLKDYKTISYDEKSSDFRSYVVKTLNVLKLKTLLQFLYHYNKPYSKALRDEKHGEVARVMKFAAS